MEMLLQKLEAMQIDVVWFVMAFVGVILAIGSREIESITRAKILQTFCCGMALGVSAPVILQEVFGFDSAALLGISAMLVGFFGMYITAQILKLDLQDVFRKRFGGETKK